MWSADSPVGCALLPAAPAGSFPAVPASSPPRTLTLVELTGWDWGLTQHGGRPTQPAQG